MKKIKLMLAACLLATCASAQYGQRTYPHPNTILSSAKSLLYGGGGFLVSGFNPGATGVQPDFIIDRRDINGDTIFGAFSKEYFLNLDTACNSMQPHGCTGVSVIETQNTPVGYGYALAASYAGGIVFENLDVLGMPVPSSYQRWTFPNGSFGKPTIIESSTPGEFYICAQAGINACVIKVRNNGTYIFSEIYNGQNLSPRGIIESPYGNNEVLVVGLSAMPTFLADEAFLLRLDATNGNINKLIFYSDSTSGDEWFTSIQPALSPAGGQGYIIGGHVYSGMLPSSVYQPWMIKVDKTGIPIWSTLIAPANAGHAIEINDVFERHNTMPGAAFPYEYYGAAGCTNVTDNITVWKLDQNGGNSGFTQDEFVYSVGPGTHLYSAYSSTQLEFIGNGPNGGDGFQTWTTDEPNGDYKFFKAYYNGVTGCHETIGVNKLTQGPGISAYPVLTSGPLFNACISPAGISHLPILMSRNGCWAPTAPGGNNTRMAATTGINEAGSVSEKTSIYPNPSNNKINVSFNAGDNSAVKIEVHNSLGQIVKTINTTKLQAGNYTEEIDFENMNAKAGIYFVNVTVGNSTSTHKIVYLNTN